MKTTGHMLIDKLFTPCPKDAHLFSGLVEALRIRGEPGSLLEARRTAQEALERAHRFYNEWCANCHALTMGAVKIYVTAQAAQKLPQPPIHQWYEDAHWWHGPNRKVTVTEKREWKRRQHEWYSAAAQWQPCEPQHARA